MTRDYRWTQDRDGIVARMWMAGRIPADIGEVIGATRSMVVGRAKRLGLPEHVNSNALRPRAAPRVHPVSDDEERQKLIKLPEVAFLRRRLPGEPESLQERWR